ncbi:MAG: hypothetical protein ABJB33_05200, partial [Gemmatimonadota bacterium]
QMSSTGESTNLHWYRATPEEAAVMAAELEAAGWSETSMPHASMPGMSIRPFRRGDRQRVLILGGSFLSLLDTRAE